MTSTAASYCSWQQVWWFREAQADSKKGQGRLCGKVGLSVNPGSPGWPHQDLCHHEIAMINNIISSALLLLKEVLMILLD